MATRSRFDAAPLQDKFDADNPRWQKWFQDMWASVNAVALPLPTAVTVLSSPSVYQFQRGGRGRLIVVGGTVSLVEWSRDGLTYYTVGIGAGAYMVAQGDYLRVTYSAAPTLTQILD